MTRDQFKQKVIKMFEELDDNKDLELYFHIVVYENDRAVDIEIATTGCTLCHRDALEFYIKQENIQHLSSNKLQVH